MSKVKKNVYQEFMQDDYVPQNDEYIVKYVAGKGNNLHEVEDVSGIHYLVSMPKKFRQTVWLKKNDCIVVRPISEGKKVLGEIICVIPVKSVVKMLESNEWRPKGGDPQLDKDSYIKFFQKHIQLREDDPQLNTSLISSDEESSEEETGSEEAESGDEDIIDSDEERKLELEISSDSNSDKHDSVASGS